MNVERELKKLRREHEACLAEVKKLKQKNLKHEACLAELKKKRKHGACLANHYLYESRWEAQYHIKEKHFSLHLDISSRNKQSDFLMNMANRDVKWSDSIVEWQKKTGLEIYLDDGWCSREYDCLFFKFSCGKEKVDNGTVCEIQKQVADIFPKLLDEVYDGCESHSYRLWRERLEKILDVDKFPVTDDNPYKWDMDGEHLWSSRYLVIDLFDEPPKKKKKGNFLYYWGKNIQEFIRKFIDEVKLSQIMNERKEDSTIYFFSQHDKDKMPTWLVVDPLLLKMATKQGISEYHRSVFGWIMQKWVTEMPEEGDSCSFEEEAGPYADLEFVINEGVIIRKLPYERSDTLIPTRKLPKWFSEFVMQQLKKYKATSGRDIEDCLTLRILRKNHEKVEDDCTNEVWFEITQSPNNVLTRTSPTPFSATKPWFLMRIVDQSVHYKNLYRNLYPESMTEKELNDYCYEFENSEIVSSEQTCNPPDVWGECRFERPAEISDSDKAKPVMKRHGTVLFDEASAGALVWVGEDGDIRKDKDGPLIAWATVSGQPLDAFLKFKKNTMQVDPRKAGSK